MFKKFILIALLAITLKGQTRQFEFYGFGQVDFETSNEFLPVRVINQNRINLIGEYLPVTKIRILGDSEFSYGKDPNSEKYSAKALISRLWAEYSFAPEFKVRVGRMLTPFGLYNLIHDASATYYSVYPPLMFVPIQLFPNTPPQRLYGKYITGLEILGVIELNDEGEQIEYSFGTGSGRGTGRNYLNPFTNTAFTGRLAYRPSWFWGFQAGTSFYIDNNPRGIAGRRNDRESSYSIDLQYEDDQMQIQSEGMMATFSGLSGDRQAGFIAYIQFAYTAFASLTPFINYSVVQPDSRNPESGFDRTNFGLNYAFSPWFFIKGEYQFHSVEENLFRKESFEVLKFTFAFAF